MDLHKLIDIIPISTYHFIGINKINNIIKIPYTILCPFVFSFDNIDLILEIWIKNKEYIIYFYINGYTNTVTDAVTNQAFCTFINIFVKKVILMGAVNLPHYMLSRLLRLGVLQIKRILGPILRHNIYNIDWYFRKLSNYIEIDYNIIEFEKKCDKLALVDKLGWRPELNVDFYDSWTVTIIKTMCSLNTNPKSRFYMLPIELMHEIFGYIAILK